MTHALDTRTATATPLKPVWTRPGEARKALLAGLVAFAGPAIIAGTENVQHGWSYVALSLWLTAVVGGLAAIAGVFWLPNDPAGKKVLTDDVIRALLDVAAHKPVTVVAQDVMTTVADAEQVSFKHRYVLTDTTPPESAVVSTGPSVTGIPSGPQPPSPSPRPAFTGPIPPVSPVVETLPSSVTVLSGIPLSEVVQIPTTVVPSDVVVGGTTPTTTA